MKTLQQYLDEADEKFNPPVVGDNFAIEIDDVLIESYIVDIAADGYVIAADDRVLELLEHCGCTKEQELQEQERLMEIPEELEEEASEEIAEDSLAGILKAAGLPPRKIREGFAPMEFAPLDEVSLDLAKKARDKAEYFVDMDYDDMRDRPYGYSEKQRTKFQRYIDKKEPRAKGDRDWSPPEQGVAEGEHPKTWHDVDPKLGKQVDKMSQAEKVSKGFAHSDTLKKKTSFIQKLDAKLQQLGYTPTQEGNVYRWTSPTRQFVEVEPNTEDPGWYGWAEGQVTRSGKLNYGDSGNDSAKDIVAIFKSGGVFRKQGVAEGFHSDLEMELHQLTKNPDINDAIYNALGRNDPVGQHLQDMMYDVARENRLHPDDDIEQIIDVMADRLEDKYGDPDISEAKYQGRTVPLGKPMKGDVKKSKVYVKGPKGNVVKVNFGDKTMRIKKNIPGRRKNFRARHNCDNPGPRHKARFWSCRAW